jgi:hypothetical protein
MMFLRAKEPSSGKAKKADPSHMIQFRTISIEDMGVVDQALMKISGTSVQREPSLEARVRSDQYSIWPEGVRFGSQTCR